MQDLPDLKYLYVYMGAGQGTRVPKESIEWELRTTNKDYIEDSEYRKKIFVTRVPVNRMGNNFYTLAYILCGIDKNVVSEKAAERSTASS